MIVTLTRNAYSPEMGTFGEIVIDGEKFFTVERPWLGNEPFYSCVPEGLYKCSMEDTTTPVPKSFSDKTWYLVGGSVGLNVGQRTRIAIHIANIAKDVAGCIGVGLSMGCVRNQWAVQRSSDALERLGELLPDQFELHIVREESTSD